MTRWRLNAPMLAFLAVPWLLSLTPPHRYPIGPVPHLIYPVDYRSSYLPDDHIEIVARTYHFDDRSEVTVERQYPIVRGWPYPDQSDWRALQAWDDWEAGRKAAMEREDRDVRDEATEAARRRPGEQTWIHVGEGRGPLAGRQGRYGN